MKFTWQPGKNSYRQSKKRKISAGKTGNLAKIWNYPKWLFTLYVISEAVLINFSHYSFLAFFTNCGAWQLFV